MKDDKLKTPKEIDTKCPICNDNSYILVYTKKGNKTVSCKVCHIHFNVEWE